MVGGNDATDLDNNGTKERNIMARTATKFENHQTFGTFPVSDDGTPQEVITADGLTSEMDTVVASDTESQRSGEVNVPIYKAETLDAALALYGGSEAELVKFAIGAYNDRTRAAAKRHILATIEGPEKTINKLLKRLAKHFDTDFDTLKAKVEAKPEYLQMLLDMAK